MVKKRTCQSNLTGHKNNHKKLVDAIEPCKGAYLQFGYASLTGL